MNRAKGKRDGLAAHSKLHLNSQMVAKNPDHWDEAGIDARASSLCDVAKIIWPSAQAFG